MSQTFYVCLRFCFMILNGKLFSFFSSYLFFIHFNWLSIDMKNITGYGASSYLESIVMSFPFDSQTGKLYP